MISKWQPLALASSAELPHGEIITVVTFEKDRKTPTRAKKLRRLAAKIKTVASAVPVV